MKINASYEKELLRKSRDYAGRDLSDSETLLEEIYRKIIKPEKRRSLSAPCTFFYRTKCLGGLQ